jgi:hypothetical protein
VAAVLTEVERRDGSIDDERRRVRPLLIFFSPCRLISCRGFIGSENRRLAVAVYISAGHVDLRAAGPARYTAAGRSTRDGRRRPVSRSGRSYCGFIENSCRNSHVRRCDVERLPANSTRVAPFTGIPFTGDRCSPAARGIEGGAARRVY